MREKELNEFNKIMELITSNDTDNVNLGHALLQNFSDEFKLNIFIGWVIIHIDSGIIKNLTRYKKYDYTYPGKFNNVGFIIKYYNVKKKKRINICILNNYRLIHSIILDNKNTHKEIKLYIKNHLNDNLRANTNFCNIILNNNI